METRSSLPVAATLESQLAAALTNQPHVFARLMTRIQFMSVERHEELNRFADQIRGGGIPSLQTILDKLREKHEDYLFRGLGTPSDMEEMLVDVMFIAARLGARPLA